MPTRHACRIARWSELRGRWLAFCDNLGVARRHSVPAGKRLLGSWDRIPRHYHDTRHLQACLRALDAVCTQPGDSTAWQPSGRTSCELALWFHDAVYWPKRSDNEEASAAWARRFLAAAGQPPGLIQQVESLVLATRHFQTPLPQAPRPEALDWVLDIDLGILGQPPGIYSRFEADVRKEYRHVPDSVWRLRRPAVLQSFLDRDTIYRTAFFRDRLEASARRNLTDAIAVLRAL